MHRYVYDVSWQIEFEASVQLRATCHQTRSVPRRVQWNTTRPYLCGEDSLNSKKSLVARYYYESIDSSYNNNGARAHRNYNGTKYNDCCQSIYPNHNTNTFGRSTVVYGQRGWIYSSWLYSDGECELIYAYKRHGHTIKNGLHHVYNMGEQVTT